MSEKLKTISIRITPELMNRIDSILVPKRMPRTTWVYQAMMDKIKKDEKENNDLD